MAVSEDQQFLFDVQGYLLLRGALAQEEVAEALAMADEVDGTDVRALNGGDAARLDNQLNRPLSRVLDVDPRFARFLDHPAVEMLLAEFVGEGYRHIDNDLYYTFPGYAGGVWHRGVRSRPTGHVEGGRFTCPMVKVFYCLTDVGPDDGPFVVVPGSHKAAFEVAMDRLDLPGQRVFDDVRAGDVIVFDEGLLHNGRPNRGGNTRKTIIMNFGREDAGAWPGYAPNAETLDAVTPRQREILSSGARVWSEPELVGV